MSKTVSGFSKLTKDEKIEWLDTHVLSEETDFKKTIHQYWNKDKTLQNLHDDFIENTLSNFYVPYAVAPNFVINDKKYVIPMAIEESSVVAAASMVAKFWSTRGGFKTEVINTTKVGQVHFMYSGAKVDLETYYEDIKPKLFKVTSVIIKNISKRWGGILDIALLDKKAALKNYNQLHVTC